MRILTSIIQDKLNEYVNCYEKLQQILNELKTQMNEENKKYELENNNSNNFKRKKKSSKSPIKNKNNLEVYDTVINDPNPLQKEKSRQNNFFESKFLNQKENRNSLSNDISITKQNNLEPNLKKNDTINLDKSLKSGIKTPLANSVLENLIKKKNQLQIYRI